MSKDVNRDSVKLHTYNRNDSQNNISKNDNIRTIKAKNNALDADTNSHADSSHKRLNRLRRAIGAGRFIINPSRVAEKLIQFESQLST